VTEYFLYVYVYLQTYLRTIDCVVDSDMVLSYRCTLQVFGNH